MASRWVQWERLHHRQGLNGGIGDVAEQQVSQGQVAGVNVIRRHKAALQAGSFVADIGDIQEDLTRQLPLEIQSPILKIRGMGIVRLENANTTLKASGWTEPGI